MDDKNWGFGVVANIVKTHTDEDGNIWYGTKAYTGGTKVYLDIKNYFNYERTEIAVVGLNRFHHYRIEAVDPNLLENVRFQIIRKPGILREMDGAYALDGWNWYGRTAEDKREAKRFVENWENHRNDMNERRGRRKAQEPVVEPTPSTKKPGINYIKDFAKKILERF